MLASTQFTYPGGMEADLTEDFLPWKLRQVTAYKHLKTDTGEYIF